MIKIGNQYYLLSVESSEVVSEVKSSEVVSEVKFSKAICNQITAAGLQHLSQVHTLNLKGCDQITDAGLQYLSQVNRLNLQHCEGKQIESPEMKEGKSDESLEEVITIYAEVKGKTFVDGKPA